MIDQIQNGRRTGTAPMAKHLTVGPCQRVMRAAGSDRDGGTEIGFDGQTFVRIGDGPVDR